MSAIGKMGRGLTTDEVKELEFAVESLSMELFAGSHQGRSTEMLEGVVERARQILLEVRPLNSLHIVAGQERLGQVIDRLDAIGHALQMPLLAQMHVKSLKTVIPEMVTEIKAAFVSVTGQNPWD